MFGGLVEELESIHRGLIAVAEAQGPPGRGRLEAEAGHLHQATGRLRGLQRNLQDEQRKR